MTPVDLLPIMGSIAREAGSAIMVHYDGTAGVTRKADQSPLTVADLASQDTIIRGLQRISPALPIVSEEGWIPSPDEQQALERFWLVDPLDGTKEYLGRNGEFTVNIALIERGEPVAGVVFAPAAGVLYLAAAGHGSWRENGFGGSPTRLTSSPRPSGEPLTVVESRSHPSRELEDWLGTIPVARRVSAGSSLKFCLVAEGSADVYPRFGATMEWDVAAGDCVFRWSGRNGPRRSPLRYNKPGLRNGAFIIGLE